MKEGNFAKRLKSLMQSRGLDIEDLRIRSGLKRAIIQEFLEGSRLPNDRELTRLGIALGLNHGIQEILVQKLTIAQELSLPTVIVALEQVGELHRLPELMAVIKNDSEHRGDHPGEPIIWGTREVNAWLVTHGLTDFGEWDEFSGLH